MLPKVVGYRFRGCDQSRDSEIRQRLAASGVQVSAPDTAQRLTILCFGELDDELLLWMDACRAEPEMRVLALATSVGVLPTSDVWRLLHAGAADVLAWEGDPTARQIRDKLERWDIVERLTAAALAEDSLAGESAAWKSLVRRVVEAARFSRAPVLLTGQTGTGKELLARLIHSVTRDRNAAAARNDLVIVDCGSLVPELSGSELFGHERGAFTGAHAAREGAFALANGATLFLDEIGELPLVLQPQLLRALQEKTYKPVGGNVWIKTDFRLVCATNRDLAALVESGRFRLDLYHRIAGWVFRTLPIAERREDILPLASHFLRRIAPASPAEFDPAVRDFLLRRDYPGNLRELRQLIERMAHRRAGAGPITAGDIPEEDRPARALPRPWPDERLDAAIADAIALGASLREISTATASTAIRIAVQSEHGNLQRAAKRLGVTDRALQLRRAAGGIPD
jgi:transcriptional regulator with GAF, ATPase, and Fis domain